MLYISQNTSVISFQTFQIQEIFGACADQVFPMRNPTPEERRAFFTQLIKEMYKLPQKPIQKGI